MDLSALSGLAAYQGTCWSPRSASHEEEVAAGLGWRRVGVCAEWAPLRLVLLVLPGLSWPPVEDWNAAQYRGPVDPLRLREELLLLAAAYRRQGVETIIVNRDEYQPNAMFARDTVVVTRAGVVVGRMSSDPRAGEERTISRDLAAHGVPILATTHGSGTLEGADVLWLDENHVLVGTGGRTNREGVRQLTGVLADLGVRTSVVPMPDGVQHLLGFAQILDRDLVLLRRSLAPTMLGILLESIGVRVGFVDDDAEVVDRQGFNVVPIRPRRVVMPTGCPRTEAALTAHGVEVVERVDVPQLITAAGGIACATGVLGRW
jgi:N-dimethylarginine dimethylaminohydrolase